jgi:lipopolysaccharide export system permease protein
MNRLDRYLARQIFWFSLLVLAVLVCLAGLFVFIDQQSDVGTGTFTVGDALFVTFLRMPQQAFQLLPIAALIGSLLGLGNLARGSELIVIRAAGVSTLRVALAAGAAGLVMFLGGALVGEALAPPLEAYADHIVTFAKHDKFSFAGEAGIWVKDGTHIVNIAQQSADNMFGGLYSFAVGSNADGRQRLDGMARADRAELVAGKRWRLRNYADSSFGAERVDVRHLPLFEQDSGISAEFLGIATVNPDAMPVRGLYRYLRELRANGLDTRGWEVALWSRVARSLSTVLMCMLAVPFVFGPLRASGAGSRTVIGIAVGVVYFLVNRTLENSGDVYGLDPLLVAWAPVAALALVTAAGIARAR